MWFFETNEITQENVLDQIKRLREQVGSKPITDTEIDQTRKYIASVRADGSVNPTEEGTFVDWEDLVHKRNNGKMNIMQDTHGRINNLSWNESTQDIVAYKKQLEAFMNAPLTVETLTWFLKELPSENTASLKRAFMVQTMVGKFQRDGYMLYTTGNGVVVESENESLRENAVVLQEAIRSHMQHEYINYHDFDQAFITGSQSLGTYRSTQANINERNTGEYADFLMKKYNIDRQSAMDSRDITSRSDIPKEDRTFLVSYLAHGIPPTTPLAPMLENYDAQMSQVQALVGKLTDAQNALPKAPDATMGTGESTPSANPKKLSEEIVRNPASALAGSPFTLMAITYGLGRTKEWFSLWTAITRILGLFIGFGVAKEWGMNPGKIIWGGVDILKDGGKKAGELAKDAAKTAGNVADDITATPTEKVKNPSPAQKYLREKIEADSALKTEVNSFSGAQKQNNGEKNAEFPEYINYIESNLDSFPLEKILDKDHKKSIYSPYADFDISIRSNMDPVVFKKVLRAYIQWAGYENLTGTGDLQWEPEKNRFIQEYGLKTEDIADKKLSDIISDIHKKRLAWSGGVTPPPAPTSAPVWMSHTAPSTIVEIAWVQVKAGTVVKVESPASMFKEDGTPELISGNSQLFVGAKPRIVSVDIKQLNGQPCIQVEHSGQKFYVPVSALKTL